MSLGLSIKTKWLNKDHFFVDPEGGLISRTTVLLIHVLLIHVLLIHVYVSFTFLRVLFAMVCEDIMEYFFHVLSLHVLGPVYM